MYAITQHEFEFLTQYKIQMVDQMHMIYPQLTSTEIGFAVDQSIIDRLMNHPVIIDNNYKKMQVQSTLLELTQYIYDKKPIITNQGVMFANHQSNIPNPIAKMLIAFLNDRKAMKKLMFQFPKGTADFAKYNLLQLLLKIDANGFYGVGGQYSSIYYNLYCASATTTQGKQANATAALFFEMFMSNNVPFESIEELFGFIANVKNEKRRYNSYLLGLRQIPLEECFFKLLYNCGFDWIPTDEELELVWKALANLDGEILTRLYYKNNLYEFCDNPVINQMIINMLCKLEKPFLNPNEPPNEIRDMIDQFTDILREYVFYYYQIPSKLEKMDALIRDVSIIQDTDSCIISFDGWYRYILNKTSGIPMNIKQTYMDVANDTIKEKEFVPDFDFFNDEIIEQERLINPVILIPQDGLRLSIINIIGYSTGILLNEYVEQMARNFGAIYPTGCRLFLKNEFTFRRTLLSDAKKHYATYQEYQEGNPVPEEKSLDVKGMEAFVKSTMNENTKIRLKKILYEDILKTPTIDQVNIIKQLSIFEKEIYQSIQAGNKEYYKPVKVRSASAYDKPMFIQGIKASVAYNELHDPDTEAIDTTIRNSLDIVKTEITPKNISKIKDEFPEVYERAVNLMSTNQYYKNGIDSIAIPLNEEVPKWVLPFVRYAEIINDNVGKFPLESVGLFRGNDNNNVSNLVAF